MDIIKIEMRIISIVNNQEWQSFEDCVCCKNYHSCIPEKDLIDKFEITKCKNFESANKYEFIEFNSLEELQNWIKETDNG